jgi:hypothetical protein
MAEKLCVNLSNPLQRSTGLRSLTALGQGRLWVLKARFYINTSRTAQDPLIRAKVESAKAKV